MLIDQIRLYNFRSYQGEQGLSLSTNPEKHVTIISGENGFGKTSLLTAMVWGLYGKLMADVDERYRKEIYESGGYNKYATNLMNRHALQLTNAKNETLRQQYSKTNNVLDKKSLKTEIEHLYSFSASIKLTNIFIPHLSCNDVTITRTYNTSNDQEKLEILIDGKLNELTRTIGQEIFINDFILPKEIAKFFFFDAEKITALAEVKNLEEKLYFSKAYNEVLGIKKYTDLKQNLENLHLRISKKSASKGDLKRIELLEERLQKDEDLLAFQKFELEKKEQDWLIKKADLAEIQERLVRAGSSMTFEELQEYKTLRNNLQVGLARNKSNFNELLDLAPFAMLAGKMKSVQKQISVEERQQHINLVNDLLKEKYEALKKAFSYLDISDHVQVDAVLQENLYSKEDTPAKVLLEFTPAQINQFNAVYDNLQNAYAKSFKGLVAEAKRLQSSYNLTQKKVQDAEMKVNDPVIQKLKLRFEALIAEVERLEQERIDLKVELGVLEKEITSINRQLSEQTKHIKIEKQDQQKVETAARLVTQLETFICQLKQKKKISLEKNVRIELNGLMHKHNFVHRVDVKIEGDLIDIDLYDNEDNIINKDSLSKGEQQLYATAVLKALVIESNIQFPVFTLWLN